jgi:hypothetical protein
MMKVYREFDGGSLCEHDTTVVSTAKGGILPGEKTMENRSREKTGMCDEAMRNTSPGGKKRRHGRTKGGTKLRETKDVTSELQ